MSLTASLNSALTGLAVAQRGLSVTANNVANANTEGFSRKAMGQEALVLAGQGHGVVTSEIDRITDRFLNAEVRRQTSTVGHSATLERFHDLLQDAFGAPGDSRDLAVEVGDLAAAIESLANSPETAALGVEVVNAARNLAGSIDNLVDRAQALRSLADQDIATAIDDLNQELQAVHDLNVEINRLANIGELGPELLDKRDQLVVSIAEKIQIGTFEIEGNRLAINTADGVPLVDYRPRILSYEPAAVVDATTTFGRIAVLRADEIDPGTGLPLTPTSGVELVSSGVRASLTPELQNDAFPDVDQIITSRVGSGRIQGLLESRDQVLPEVDDQLQELAANLRFALNAAHNDASPVPPPAQLTGTRTDLTDFAGATRTGLATIAVIDTTDGSTVAAFQVDVGAAADETAIATQIDAGLGALGSASITAGGNLEITLAGAGQGLAVAEGDSSVSFADAAGRTRDFGLAHYFGLNDFLVSSGSRASNFEVRPDIATDPARVGTARLDVQIGPLVATLGGSGDNRGIQRLAAALGQEHDFLARGGLPARPATLAGYAGDIIANSAIRAQQAGDAASADRAFADALGFRVGAVSGVNLDEEMARMVQLQQAYAVAARVVSITSELFDELISTVR